MENQSLAVATYGLGVAGVVEKSNKRGNAVTATYLDRKSYGKQHNLTGAALDRAHLAYRMELGLAGNVNIAAKLAGGDWLVDRVKSSHNKTGRVLHTVTFVEAAQLQAPPATAAEALKEVSVEELLAEIAKRKAAEVAK